jgi:hypothetical protein
MDNRRGTTTTKGRWWLPCHPVNPPRMRLDSVTYARLIGKFGLVFYKRLPDGGSNHHWNVLLVEILTARGDNTDDAAREPRRPHGQSGTDCPRHRIAATPGNWLPLKGSPGTIRQHLQVLETLADWTRADAPGKTVGYYGYNTLTGLLSRAYSPVCCLMATAIA